MSGVPLADVCFRRGPQSEGEAQGGSQIEVSCPLQVTTRTKNTPRLNVSRAFFHVHPGVEKNIRHIALLFQ